MKTVLLVLTACFICCHLNPALCDTGCAGSAADSDGTVCVIGWENDPGADGLAINKNLTGRFSVG